MKTHMFGNKTTKIQWVSLARPPGPPGPKACKLYADGGWVFENGHEYKLAKNTIDALKYICERSGNEEGKEFLHVNPQLKEA